MNTTTKTLTTTLIATTAIAAITVAGLTTAANATTTKPTTTDIPNTSVEQTVKLTKKQYKQAAKTNIDAYTQTTTKYSYYNEVGTQISGAQYTHTGTSKTITSNVTTIVVNEGKDKTLLNQLKAQAIETGGQQTYNSKHNKYQKTPGGYNLTTWTYINNETQLPKVQAAKTTPKLHKGSTIILATCETKTNMSETKLKNCANQLIKTQIKQIGKNAKNLPDMPQTKNMYKTGIALNKYIQQTSQTNNTPYTPGFIGILGQTVAQSQAKLEGMSQLINLSLISNYTGLPENSSTCINLTDNNTIIGARKHAKLEYTANETGTPATYFTYGACTQ